MRAKSAPTPPSGTVTVKLSQKDVSFIQKAAGGDQQEVENGKMAEKQGKSADVKTAKTLPTLQEHLAMVEAAMSKVK